MNTNEIAMQGIFTLIGILIVFLIIFLIIFAIWRAIKRFTFEIIDRTHGINTSTSTGKKDYTREARQACEKVTPKRKQNTTPPWEE